MKVPAGYVVTEDGRVFSKRYPARELRQWINGSGYGYPCVYLYVRGTRVNYAVYRLVAAAHLPKRPSRAHVIMHRDGDRMNSHKDNLKWGTKSENSQHAYADYWERRRAEDARRDFGSAPPVSKPPKVW